MIIFEGKQIDDYKHVLIWVKLLITEFRNIFHSEQLRKKQWMIRPAIQFKQ